MASCPKVNVVLYSGERHFRISWAGSSVIVRVSLFDEKMWRQIAAADTSFDYSTDQLMVRSDGSGMVCFIMTVENVGRITVVIPADKPYRTAMGQTLDSIFSE